MSASTRSAPLQRLRRPWLVAAALLVVMPVAFLYVSLSFTDPHPWTRILLRSLPILPLAVWTLWFDRQRPFQRMAAPVRAAARIATLLGIMALTVVLLGIALNWLYDPARVV